MIPRQYILILYWLLLSSNAFAQKDSTWYFDHEGKLVNDPNLADYHRVINSRDGDIYRFTEYWKDGSVVKSLAMGNILMPKCIGDVTLYYPNGKVHERHDYENGHPVKTLRYHQNGTLLQTIIYGYPYNRLIYEADSTGAANILNGNGTRTESGTYMLGFNVQEKYTMEGPYVNGVKNGVWKGTDDRGYSFEETYQQNKNTGGQTIAPDGKKYLYHQIYAFALLNGKGYEVYLFIKKNLRQPSDTLQLAREGNILSLDYTVTEKGEIADIYGRSNIDKSKVYLELKKQPFKVAPATLRGVPVSCVVPSFYGIPFKRSSKSAPFNTDIYLNGQYSRPVIN